MLIRLHIVHQVFKMKTVYEKLDTGEEYPEKKEVLVKEIKICKWFEKDAITSIEDYVTQKNKVAKNRSIIFDRYSGKFYITWHSLDEVVSMLNKPKQPIGFNGNHIHT